MKNEQSSLRNQLEIQAIQIEQVLNRHNVKGEIKGGTANSRFAHFDLQTQLTSGWQRFLSLKSDLVTSLGVPDVKLVREDGQLRVSVRRPSPHPVDLLALIDSVPDLTSHTAVLGLDDDERPLLLNLMAPDVTNVLIAGGRGAGKSGLLRSLALSLAVSNRQAHVQLVIFDGPSGPEQPFTSQLYPLSYLPHMMFPIVESVEDAAETLAFLADEVAYRQEQPVSDPLVVILIDNVDRLVVEGGAPVQEPLIYLLQEGPAAGMRTVLAAGDPGVPELRPLLIGHVPIRLVGQVADARQARLATGQSDSQAEYLLGRGDFLAAAGGSIVPFQVAYVGDYDLHLALEKLYERSHRGTMLAQTMDPYGQSPVGSAGSDDDQLLQSAQAQEAQLESRETGRAQQRAEHPAADDQPDSSLDLAAANWEQQERLDPDMALNSPAPDRDRFEVGNRMGNGSSRDRSQDWSDAFFDFLNSTDFDRPVADSEEIAKPQDEVNDSGNARPSGDPTGIAEQDCRPVGEPKPFPPAAARRQQYTTSSDSGSKSVHPTGKPLVDSKREKDDPTNQQPAAANGQSSAQATGDDWDDFWHNDDYWQKDMVPGLEADDSAPAVEDVDGELIYEDISDDFGLIDNEDESRDDTMNEEE